MRAADAKEVVVGHPAEETCCYPNTTMLQFGNGLSIFLAQREPLNTGCFGVLSRLHPPSPKGKTPSGETFSLENRIQLRPVKKAFSCLYAGGFYLKVEP